MAINVCFEVKKFYSSLQEMVGLRRRKAHKRQVQISEPFNFKKETTTLPGLTQDEITVLREKAAASRLGISDADLPSSRQPRRLSVPLPLTLSLLPMPIPIPNSNGKVNNHPLRQHHFSGAGSSLRSSSTATAGTSTSTSTTVYGYGRDRDVRASVSMNDLLLIGENMSFGKGLGEGMTPISPLDLDDSLPVGGGGGGMKLDMGLERLLLLESPVSPVSPAGLDASAGGGKGRGRI